MVDMNSKEHVVILGAGPAGLAVLLAAASFYQRLLAERPASHVSSRQPGHAAGIPRRQRRYVCRPVGVSGPREPGWR